MGPPACVTPTTARRPRPSGSAATKLITGGDDIQPQVGEYRTSASKLSSPGAGVCRATTVPAIASLTPLTPAVKYEYSLTGTMRSTATSRSVSLCAVAAASFSVEPESE